MQFVPENARTEQVPCTHIPLSPSGDTLESLYRTGTQQEIEEALGSWLRATIRRLEAEKARQGAADPPGRSALTSKIQKSCDGGKVH